MRFLVLLAAVSLVVACGDNQDPAGADDLWQRIHDEDYRSFARPPGYETRQPSNTAHSDEVDVYMNATIAGVLEAADPLTEWPTGSLIVKDGFSGGELELVAVMEKRSDGWYFVEYTDVENGGAKFSGRPEVCLECHTPAGNDHVNTIALPQ